MIKYKLRVTYPVMEIKSNDYIVEVPEDVDIHHYVSRNYFDLIRAQGDSDEFSDDKNARDYGYSKIKVIGVVEE